MAGVSVSRVWDETWAFLRAEVALLAPLALATTGTAMLLLTLVMPEPVNDRLPQGPWLLWLIPAYALLLLGVLSISALVLRPGLSVAESLTTAARRLPIAAGVVLLLAAISLAASMPVALATAIDVRRGGAAGGLTAIANALMLVALVWLWVRLLPMWAVVVEGGRSPIAALRDSLAMTRGHAGRLLALTVVAMGAGIVIGAALLFAGGAILMIVGRALAGPELGSLLVSILLAALVAAGTTVWTVLVAFLYRQLAERRSA